MGRLIAEQGLEVKLLPYTIQTVADFQSFKDLFLKRLRWIVVMRNMRPWGHLGLIFTFGLPWTLIGMALSPSALIASAFAAVYLGLRTAMTLQTASWGLKQATPLAMLSLFPIWDGMAFVIWLVSFTRSTIRWRDRDYYIRGGQLVPADGNGLLAQPEVRKEAALTATSPVQAEVAASQSASHSAPSAS